ncbi:MAG: (E)-4-hydroxy-3-methylbut-2-enyl-diphosphate synthase [Waddliaceae bacterium]|jgi:(E)-4-hydroxy-3-methylbut-2-enyl-diphosphate synthase|nr:(E)-4-hydroxy-3-methylbut-2-enyl-diphosphate synthase [Waddliaceae bacterium]MBT3579293.1 (E)-4-hydroxy-3-methylbut-2-enyl-diphosphate synthase [Waddliaceae bacterium]MBT4444727.1 (E)-4-hydroxy-3-methylbut-2-enyl-diphosphate synthase [Waddliaceae bacterium]MBT6928438.1 (E)-4-hydroxy-3-methylbut-2-enyl-diphosphate synthase [Waddliaceae bacterium]MBT7264084.1 (E)-4-hydroxy-3-methylbut-2-enyl-diphosphate synthase [Waddliaceae bacterium]
MKYCEAINTTKRRTTREVMVGDIGIGGNNPIRIQSMTNTKTSDVDATVAQIIALADAGCEIARVTVQGMREASACSTIKSKLRDAGYTIPIVADIHFMPRAALEVIEHVDKVRINPGNYADKRATFDVIEYDDDSYRQELESIEEKFSPLVKKCKKLKKAMRIGVNHGSLSDRIMSRYGDTAKGMVESAMEFATICRKDDFHDIIFSMKASNPIVMIQAYRLLAAEMYKKSWDYPLHLGVTEAGEGEDGRVRSAMGIGALLLDGLGDTIRVSLTEDPTKEIAPCKTLAAFAENYIGKGTTPFEEKERIRRKVIVNAPLHSDGSALTNSSAAGFDANINDIDDTLIIDEDTPWDDAIAKAKIIILRPKNNRLHYARAFHQHLCNNNITTPLILDFSYTCPQEDLVIEASAEFGALLTDGIGDGILIDGDYDTNFLRTLSFSILQAARMRTTKTEFISCPGCGRTLFDIQSVVKKVQKKLGNLPGVKIAIMGCIVNGPGEMADADYGYVGSAPHKVDLYVGKKCVEKNIDESHALERLSQLCEGE